MASIGSDIKDFPLGISGFSFSDLYVPERLKDLHLEFWRYADQVSPDTQKKFSRLGAPEVTKPQEAEILIETSSILGEFIAKLFNVTTHEAKLKAATVELQPVFRFKKDFLHLRASKRFNEAPVDAPAFKLIDDKVAKVLSHEPPSSKNDREIVLSETVMFLLDCEKTLKTGALEPAIAQRVQNLCSHLHGSSLLEKVQLALTGFEDWCVQAYVDQSRR